MNAFCGGLYSSVCVYPFYNWAQPSRSQKKFDGKGPGNRAYSKYRWDMYFTDIVVVKISLSLLAFYRT